MIFSLKILILFCLALAVCLIGFKKYIWFISIGYGLSISAVAIGIIAVWHSTIPVLTLIYCIIMACYGFRLGGFLAYREIRTGYNAKMKGEISDGSSMPFGVKIALWVTCALLYIMMMAPLIYRAANFEGTNTCELIGMIISVLGIALEATADAQKKQS